MNKLLIVLTILLAGCILVSSSTAADIDVKSIDHSDSQVSSIEQNSLNDLYDSSVGVGTKNTGDDKYVTNLKAKSADDNTNKDISKLGANTTKNFTNLNGLVTQTAEGGTLTLSADDVYIFDDVDDPIQTGIKISKSIVIDGNGCTIDGSGIASAFNITANNVILKNIKFINTRTLINFGGAIYLSGANGTVSNCTFTNTLAFMVSGGAIYLSGANGTVSNCTFTNTLAFMVSGGAIYLSGANGTVSNCTFTNCTSNKNGFDDGGGAIYLSGANGTVSNCTFTNCTSNEHGYGDGGGAIFWSGADGTVTDCTFINTTSSSRYGGAVYWKGDNGTVTNCTFSNTTAEYGGAIYIYPTTSLSITDCSSNSTDDKAPIYNNGTILSPVVITTIDGKTKKVANGEKVNLTGIITTSDMRVAGGVLTLTVNGQNLDAESDETGLYSKEYTVDFVGIEPVTAIYKQSTEELQSVIPGNLTAEKLNSSVNVTDVTGNSYGQNLTITAKVTDGATGNVTFEIVNDDGDNVANKTVNITDGTATATAIFEGIPAGTDYVVGVTYNGDAVFSPAKASKTFDVNKLNPQINITGVKNVTFGETFTATITLASDINDRVSIYLNGDYKEDITITNGKGTYTIASDLAVGNYTLKAVFEGDDKYDEAETNASFEVTKNLKDVTVTVTTNVTEITFGKMINVTVTLNETVSSGTVSFILDGKVVGNKTITNNNTVSRVYSSATGLTVGKHNITAVFFGDDYNRVSGNTVVVNVKNTSSTAVSVKDTSYGKNLTVIANITADNATGTVTFIITDGKGVKIANKTVDLNADGSAVTTFSGLDVGNYTATAIYNGDEQYGNSTGNQTFRVTPIDPTNITIEVNSTNITSGETLKVYGNIIPNITGNVSLFINGKIIENQTLVNGAYEFNVTGLTQGNYTIWVKFNGNNNYNYIQSSKVNVTVAKANCTFNVNVDNITYGDNFTINVTDAVGVNGEALDGIAIVVVNGKSYFVTVTDGKGSKVGIILPAGTYSVSASFLAANYNIAENSTEFSVAKADPQVTVDIGSNESFEIKFGDTVVAIVDVPDDATGTISFSLDNETWITKTIPKNTNLVEWDIPDLDAGNYILFVKYSGDGNYNPIYSENPFTVDQLQTTVTVDPVKGKAGEKVKITVRVTDERGNPVPEGTVIIGFNGKEYKANVVNGIATIEVVLPKAGTYSATAYYEGFNYNSSYATFTVEVSDIPGPNPNPTPVNNGVGNMENTGNPLFVLLVALCAIGLESLRRKF